MSNDKSQPTTKEVSECACTATVFIEVRRVAFENGKKIYLPSQYECVNCHAVRGEEQMAALDVRVLDV